MTNLTTNEQARRQLAFYTSAVKSAMETKGESLESAIAALFMQDAPDGVLPPLVLPEDSARMLAGCIVDGVSSHCRLTRAMQRDPAAAAEAWLDDMVGDCTGKEKLAARYDLIREALTRRTAAFGGSPIAAEVLPYAGGCTDDDIRALRTSVLRMIARLEPSPAALRSLQRQMTGCGVLPDADGQDDRVLTSAVLFAMRCDGSLPAACDEVMLGELIPAVCMASGLQSAVMNDLSALRAVWCAGLLGMCGGVIKAELITPALLTAAADAVPVATVTTVAFALIPAILAGLDRVKQADAKAIASFGERLTALISEAESDKTAVMAADRVRMHDAKITE